MHLRTQIRNALAAALTGLATTGARVYDSRRYPFQTSELPGLLVKTNAEQVGVATAMRPRTLERVLDLEIEGYAADSAAIDDVLDTIAIEVEQKMAAPATNGLGGLVKSCTLTATELEFDDTAEKPHGLIRLKYEVLYFAREDTPDTAQ